MVWTCVACEWGQQHKEVPFTENGWHLRKRETQEDIGRNAKDRAKDIGPQRGKDSKPRHLAIWGSGEDPPTSVKLNSRNTVPPILKETSLPQQTNLHCFSASYFFLHISCQAHTLQACPHGPVPLYHCYPVASQYWYTHLGYFLDLYCHKEQYHWQALSQNKYCFWVLFAIT